VGLLIPASVPISAGWTGREERPNFRLIFKDLRDDRRNCTIKWCELGGIKEYTKCKGKAFPVPAIKEYGGRAVKV